MEYVIVGLLNVLLSILKVYEIKWSYDEDVLKLTILSVILATSWLITTSIGVSSLLNGDKIMVIIYIVTGSIGKVLALKIFKNARKKQNT
jgi:hypothetical protein